MQGQDTQSTAAFLRGAKWLGAGSAALLVAACGGGGNEASDTAGAGAGSSAEPAASTASAEPAATTAAATGEAPAAFAICSACHAMEPGKNSVGPSLAGVVGAKAGHVGDYAYSDAMKASGLTWDDATLDAYLENPAKLVPGTKMAFSGVADAEARKAIIAYLKGE